MRYIKLFEDYEKKVRGAYVNNNVIKPDIKYQALYKVESKLKEIFQILGLPITLGILTKAIETKEVVNPKIISDDKIIQYYRFKFNTDINCTPYSIVNLISRAELIPFVGASLEKPFDFIGRSYICIGDENVNNTFIQELTISLSKYDLNTKEPINEALTFKGYNQFFNSKKPAEIFKKVANYIIEVSNYQDDYLSNMVYTTPFGGIEITNLSFVISEFIKHNNTYNKTITIPQTIIQPLLIAIDKLPKQYEVWNGIQKNNPILYNALKSKDTDTAVTMHDKGFDD